MSGFSILGGEMKKAYAYDARRNSDAAALLCLDRDRAQQQFRLESDINELVRRFGLTGELPAARRLPEFGDFSNVGDFHSAMNALVSAREAFMEQPAWLRARFYNDPGEFLDFLEDPENAEEARKLGLLREAPVEPVTAPEAPGGTEVPPEAP